MDSRLTPALCLSFTGVLVAGCQSEDKDACGQEGGESLPGPPTLVSAQMQTDTLVRLTFSEPLASFADVDPASFRISWAFSEGPGYYEGDPGYTAYYDPMLLFCLSSDYCPYEYVDVVELGCAADDPAAIILRLDVFSHYICNLFDDIAMYYEGYQSPLLLHFDANLGVITDREGEALESISPDFVTAPDGYHMVDGEFPNYPMRIPIECPP